MGVSKTVPKVRWLFSRVLDPIVDIRYRPSQSPEASCTPSPEFSATHAALDESRWPHVGSHEVLCLSLLDIPYIGSCYDTTRGEVSVALVVHCMVKVDMGMEMAACIRTDQVRTRDRSGRLGG